MNFKGTRNIPRDQVKGIIEKFGGSWNGYTWIDQTTYLETASKDALDRMLFIEAERMDACLYDPADCESERTVIISELQGGENDPEQLLDTEVTATAFKVASLPPSDHRLADRPADDDARRSVRPLPPLLRADNATLVIVGDVDTDDALKQVETAFRRHSRLAPRRRASSRSSPTQQARAPRRACASPAPRRTGRRRFTRRRSTTTRSFPLLVADAVLNGAAGLNIWSGGGVSRAAAQRAAVSRARRQGPGVDASAAR